MGSRRDYLTKQIVWVCQKLDNKGFGANHDGNVSCRFEDKFLATPTAESKGSINEDMIILVDRNGKKIEGIGKPFSEMSLHLSAYNCRDGINAVVHAHPPFLTARGLVGLALRPSLPEAVISIGDLVPVVPFSMPGSKKSLEDVISHLDQVDIFMIAGNGVLAVGQDLEQAYLRLELAEHLAKIDYFAQQMGKPLTIPDSDLNVLLEKRASIGLGPTNYNKSPVASVATSSNNISTDPLRDLIASEIRKILAK
jgi:L-fuculose-phosphate aldolase